MSLICIVTGERDWSAVDLVPDHLLRLYRSCGGKLGLVLGDCPTGADALALEWASFNHIAYMVVANDGNWPSAGPRRNQQMIERALTWRGSSDNELFFLGFWSGKRDRSGTLDCMSRAALAGIHGYVVARPR